MLRYIYFITVILCFSVLQANAQNYKPHKLTISIDSLCDVSTDFEQGFFQLYNYPDTMSKQVARGITDYVSNMIQAVAVDNGFQYAANYRKSKKVKSDIQIIIKLLPVHSPRGGVLRRSVFSMEMVYGDKRSPMLSDTGAFDIVGDGQSYDPYFKSMKSYFWSGYFKLFDLSNHIKMTNYRRFDKTYGMNEWVSADADIDQKLVRELTTAIEQSILNRILESQNNRDGRTPYKYDWYGNYNKDEKSKKLLDYVLSCKLKSQENILVLSYYITDSEGNVKKVGRLELTESQLEKGNYIELIEGSRGFLIR